MSMKAPFNFEDSIIQKYKFVPKPVKQKEYKNSMYSSRVSFYSYLNFCQKSYAQLSEIPEMQNKGTNTHVDHNLGKK